MSDETEHAILVIVGLFTITMFASASFYGIYPLIVWFIGMSLLRKLIDAARNDNEPPKQ